MNTLLFYPQSSCTWSSNCGRYVIWRRRDYRGELVFMVYFYGYLANRNSGPATESQFAKVVGWCEEHRRRVLPQIIEFETWIAQRYGEDFTYTALGARSRRDRVLALIRGRGEQHMPLKNEVSGTSLTLAQIYSYLYESITPDRHENGDGV